MNELAFEYLLTSHSVLAYARAVDAPLHRLGERWVAPPTIPVGFWSIADAPWLDPDRVYLHGSQSFSYAKPLLADSLLDCLLVLVRSERKKGTTGMLTLYTHRLTCRGEGELIVNAETVLICPEDPA